MDSGGHNVRRNLSVSQQKLQKHERGLGRGVALNHRSRFQRTFVREHHAIDWPACGNRDAVNDSINRLPQILQAADEGDIQISERELVEKSRWAIEVDTSRPRTDEWMSSWIIAPPD